MDRIKFNKKYPGEEVRALSWKQPFASLMLHNKVETRPWNTKYRGWVLICSSKLPYNNNKLYEISGNALFENTLGMVEAVKATHLLLSSSHGIPGMITSRFPLGEAIAIGYLCGVKYMGDYVGAEGTIKEIEKKCFVRFNPELWMHEYTDVQPIVPFHWSGYQGWKKLDSETIDKIILI